jgi:hypothetical protein
LGYLGERQDFVSQSNLRRLSIDGVMDRIKGCTNYDRAGERGPWSGRSPIPDRTAFICAALK